MNTAARVAGGASRAAVADAALQPEANNSPVAAAAPGATPQAQSLVSKGGELPAPQQEPVQIMPGVYRHGFGQYSDSAKGMGFAEGFTGRPSAQNMAAASNLAAQQQRASMGRILAQQAQQAQAQQGVMQPRGFNAPQPKHSGNDWETRNHLRSLRMAAESAYENAPRKRFAAQHPAVMAYQQAMQADMQARGGQLDADLKTQEVNAAMQREQMQQQGASQRDAARLGLEAQSKGFDIRAAQRRESVMSAYDRGTPEQREELARHYPDLFPREKSTAKMEVLRGKADAQGNISPDQVVMMNPQTGQAQIVPIDGWQQSLPEMPADKSKRIPGQKYRDKNGQVVLWTEQGAQGLG